VIEDFSLLKFFVKKGLELTSPPFPFKIQHPGERFILLVFEIMLWAPGF